MLLLAAVVWMVPCAASAAVLLHETFDAAPPGSSYTGAIPGSVFHVSSGDVDIIGTLPNGAAGGFFTCPNAPGAANNCLDLNGNQPGAVTTGAGFDLRAGTTYKLSFDLAGSVPVAPAYRMQATIGNNPPVVFSIPAGNMFGTESLLYTPLTDEAGAHVSFQSVTNIPGAPHYGPLIDNVSLATVTTPPAVPGVGSSLIFQQDFSAVRPGANYAGPVANSGFTVTSGNVDVFGDGTGAGASGFFTCPAPLPSSSGCIDLNGSQPATIQSDQLFNLRAGATYIVGFQLAGNIANAELAEYALTASLGGSAPFRFAISPDSPFQTESFTYSPAADETAARLIMMSQQNTAAPLYGPVITAISIASLPAVTSSSPPSALPEPGPLAVMLSGLLGLALCRRKTRGDHP